MWSNPLEIEDDGGDFIVTWNGKVVGRIYYDTDPSEFIEILEELRAAIEAEANV